MFLLKHGSWKLQLESARVKSNSKIFIPLKISHFNPSVKETVIRGYIRNLFWMVVAFYDVSIKRYSLQSFVHAMLT